jgi:ABC-type multidrug transport system ATPase subunit
MLADRLAILDQGRLLALDSPSALVRNYSAVSLEEAFFKITGHTPSALKEPQE